MTTKPSPTTCSNQFKSEKRCQCRVWFPVGIQDTLPTPNRPSGACCGQAKFQAMLRITFGWLNCIKRPFRTWHLVSCMRGEMAMTMQLYHVWLLASYGYGHLLSLEVTLTYYTIIHKYINLRANKFTVTIIGTKSSPS